MRYRSLQFHYPEDGADGASMVPPAEHAEEIAGSAAEAIAEVAEELAAETADQAAEAVEASAEALEDALPGEALVRPEDIPVDGIGRGNEGSDALFPAQSYYEPDNAVKPYTPVIKPTDITQLMGHPTGEIVIDDEGIKHNLNAYERWVRRRKKREENAPKRAKLLRIWNIVSPILAVVVSFVLALFALKFAGNYLMRRFIQPVDPNDPTPIEVTIPSGSGAAAIAKILYEAGGEDEPGLISHKAVFKVYVDFKGKSGGLKAGTYILSRNMSVKQIVDIICTGNPPAETVKFTIAEGMTVEAIADRLCEQGILEDGARFLELCKDGTAFASNYQFVKVIKDAETGDRPYLLEGYLFPDTYEIYVDASEEDIINKMLTRFGDVYSKVYAERAEELGLTLDEVVILASIIEKEAKTFDFTKVSATLYNRMDADLTLSSDATLEYILKTGSLSLTPEQLAYPTPYNTHLYKGLPAGPISNPGAAAIEAVLYPDQQYIEEGYMYFCLMDSSTGALVFARTQEEHNANVEKYRPNW